MSALKKVPDEKVTIRSEREIMPHFRRRVYPLIPFPILGTFLYLFAFLSVIDGGVSVRFILFISLYPSILPVGLMLNYLHGSYFSLDVAEYDDVSITLRREPNYWNQRTWLLTIPFSEISRIRLNRDLYEVIRTDGSMVPLPKGEKFIGTYHRIGRAVKALIEAELDAEIPIRLPGSTPPPDPAIDYLKNAELQKTLKKQEESLQNYFTPGFLLVFFLTLYGVVMSGDLIFNQNVDAGNLSCFGILLVLLVIIITLSRTRWDAVRQTKTELGTELYDPYLKDHVILVSRLDLPGGQEPSEIPLASSFSHSGIFGPRSEKTPSGWRGLPLRINTNQTDSILTVIHALFILPLLVFGAMLFFQIIRTIGFLLDDANGIGELLEESFFSFCLGTAGFLFFLIIIRVSIGDFLYSEEIIRNNPIEQAIEDRYWGRKDEMQKLEDLEE